MATLDSDLYMRAQNGVVRLAVRDLRAFWARLDLSDPLKAREALEEFWPALLEKYGEVSATMAADRFEDVTGLDAVMVRAVDPERANARLRWALGPLFNE